MRSATLTEVLFAGVILGFVGLSIYQDRALQSQKRTIREMTENPACLVAPQVKHFTFDGDPITVRTQ
jgi:hypothetical protein